MRNVIILNKLFSGDWLNNNDNIAHEIINFLLTDCNEQYIYNLPYGFCPDEIWVDGSDDKIRTNKEKYQAKYLIMAGKFNDSVLDIKYVVELESKLHSNHYSRNPIIALKNNQLAKEYIDKNKIYYNSKPLYDAFSQQSDICQSYLTFKAKRIYVANSIIQLNLEEYNFQRNKGYIYEDVNLYDYNNLINLIENSIQNKTLEIFQPSRVENKITNFEFKSTLFDLTITNDNEQIFTNVLYNIFSYKKIFNFFLKFITKDNSNFVDDIKFEISREKVINNGRIDLYATSNKLNVIIENKIHSGLNGVKLDDSCSQLQIYYDYDYKKYGRKPLCFIIAPNYKINDLNNEINKYDPNMLKIFKIISYAKIAKFLRIAIDNKLFDYDFRYFKYLEDIYIALKNHSLTLKEFYVTKFLNALNK